MTKRHGATRSQLLKDTEQKDTIAIPVDLERKSYQFRTLHSRRNVRVHNYNDKRFLRQSRQKEEIRLWASIASTLHNVFPHGEGKPVLDSKNYNIAPLTSSTGARTFSEDADLGFLDAKPDGHRSSRTFTVC